MMKNKKGYTWIWILLILILVGAGIGVWFWLTKDSSSAGSFLDSMRNVGNSIPQPPALPD